MPINPEFAPRCLELAVGQGNQANLVEYSAYPELFDWMIANSPVPVEKATHFFTVVTYDKRAINEHQHDEDVLLYYAEPADTPLHVKGEDPYLPQTGELLHIPKGVWHSVPPNLTDKVRVSIAVKIQNG